MSTTPMKYQISEDAARSWFVTEMCFFIVFLGLMAWGWGLKDYVDEQLRREIGTTLTFLLIITMVYSAKDMIPILILMGRQIHYEIFIQPKEWEREFDERMARESEERKQKFLEELKKKDERRRRKKQKPVGEPINLQEWVGRRSYRSGGYIYILKDVEISGYYKIGKTRQPFERMKAFGVLLPFASELIHVIKCDSADRAEAQLHARYASKRKQGEWFALDQSEVDELKRIHEMTTNGLGDQVQ